MRTVEPSAARFQSFAKLEDSPEPLVMINLLRYRERAEYPADFEAEPCSGREAYGRYGEVAFAQVGKVGGRVVWAGTVVGSPIAPDDEEWDDAILVEYPSRAAFLEMLANPDYQAGAPHRQAALLDSRLIATRPAMAAAP